MVKSLPSVSVIVPARYAADKVGGALDSIRSQDYPNVVEVIVAAGDPETLRVAEESGVITVENPTGATPAALNLALGLATGDVVVRCDAQSILPPGYVTRAVDTLLRVGAANVGGMQVPSGNTYWERAIAAAMASPLGAGDARYRTGGPEGPAETVYLGVFDRSVLISLGGYDEAFLRNQDYELNHRLITSGHVVWFDPELKVTYRPRGSLRELWSQYFQYGKAKRQFARAHPGGLRPRQLAPPTLIALLVGSTLAAALTPWALSVPAGYVVALSLGVASMPRRLKANAGTVPALLTMHIAWGIGFFSG